MNNKFPYKYSVLLLLAFLAVGGLIIYAVGPSHFLVPAGLYSKENGFDFGRIPVNGRVAQAEHRFEIFNNTGHEVIIEDIKVSCSSCIGAKLSNMVIGAKESQWLDVSITIPQTQFKKQAFEIYLVPREGEPLRMTVWGRAAFSQFASITEVNFGERYLGKDYFDDFVLYSPNEKPIGPLIAKVESDSPDLVRVAVKEESSPQIADEGERYHLNQARISVQLLSSSQTKAGAIGHSRITATLYDGTSFVIPVYWFLREKPLFEPGQFLLSKDQLMQSYEFQVNYNGDVGGSPKKITMKGDKLQVAATRQDDQKTIITLKCNELAEIDLKAGDTIETLLVETDDRETHEMKVVLL